MKKIIIKTKEKKQIIDITDDVNLELTRQGLKNGLCNLMLLHTTAALTTSDMDMGTDLDMLDAFEAMIPKIKYRHPHDPSHVGDHIMSSIIGSSVLLPFSQGNLILGTWQRIVLVELDGPRERGIILTFL